MTLPQLLRLPKDIEAIGQSENGTCAEQPVNEEEFPSSSARLLRLRRQQHSKFR
jgi:hypothetical protein